MKRLIISGASGFLGSNIIKQSNLPVVAITGREEKLKEINTDIEVVDTEAFLINGIPMTEDDIFINCLFPTNADGFKMANGLEKVFRCIELAYDCGVGSLINISSQSVYNSKREVPAKEDDNLCLETPYAVAKYSSEVFSNSVFKDRKHTNIRMASLIGVDYEQRIINRMVGFALQGNPLKVVGGMQRYGFMDVRDAATGILAVAYSDKTDWKQQYNLGRYGSCTLKEIAELIKEKLNDKSIDIVINYSDGDDYRNSSIDSSIFMNDFNWLPSITLIQTVEEIIEYKMK